MASPPLNAPTPPLQQVPLLQVPAIAFKRSGGKTRRSLTYYGFEDTSFDTLIITSPKSQRRAGDVEHFQSPKVSVVGTIQSTAEQTPEETNISPVIGNMSPLDPRVRHLVDYRSPIPKNDTIFMTVYEAEVKKNSFIPAHNSKSEQYNLLNITSYDTQRIYCHYIFNRGPNLNNLFLSLLIKNCPN